MDALTLKAAVLEDTHATAALVLEAQDQVETATKEVIVTCYF
jgi:hypothetical protein